MAAGPRVPAAAAAIAVCSVSLAKARPSKRAAADLAVRLVRPLRVHRQLVRHRPRVRHPPELRLLLVRHLLAVPAQPARVAVLYRAPRHKAAQGPAAATRAPAFRARPPHR